MSPDARTAVPRACRPEWLCRLPGLPEARVVRLAAEPGAGMPAPDLSGVSAWPHGMRGPGDRGRRLPDAATVRRLTGGTR